MEGLVDAGGGGQPVDTAQAALGNPLADWNPAPSSCHLSGRSAAAHPSAGSTKLASRTVSIAGTFAVDGLEEPLQLFLDRLLGIGDAIAIQWAPYTELLDALPTILQGPAQGGAELVFLLVRLEDLCVGHPELRHAPRTKKTAKAPDATTDAERMEQERKRRAEYGCAKLEGAETQLLAAVAALDKRVMAAAETEGLRIELILFPAPPQTEGLLEAEWAAAAVVAEEWLCTRPWAVSGSRARVVPSVDLVAALWNCPSTTCDAGAGEGADADASAGAGATVGTEVEAGEFGGIKSASDNNNIGGNGDGDTSAMEQEQEAFHPWYNRQMDRLAHAPFTASLFQTTAAVMSRTLHRLVFRMVGRKSPLATKNLLEVTNGLRRPP